MSENRKIMAMDGVVSIPDGIAWMIELQKEPPLDLASRLAEYEPAVVGVAVRQADNLRNRMLRHGAPSGLATEAADSVLLTGLMCLELMRRGHAKAWEDFWQPEDAPKGDQNGK